MIKTFSPAKIIEKYKGDLSAIVTEDRRSSGVYDVYIYDPEITYPYKWKIQWTHNLRRVYVGINKDAADIAARLNDEKITVEELDKQLILSGF